MHRLIELDDGETLLRKAKPFSGGNGLVADVCGFTKAILKFSSISVCEVLGYQLAAAFGVRVPRSQGIWSSAAMEVRRMGLYAEPGRIGVLIEYHDDWIPLSWDTAARLDPAAVARALGLCVF